MDAAQVLITITGLGASTVTFFLMRFPHMRRAPFRNYGAFSVVASLLGGLAVLLFCLLLLLAQSSWQPR